MATATLSSVLDDVVPDGLTDAVSSYADELSSRVSAENARTAVGVLSVALGSLAVIAPERTAAFFGVTDRGGAVPLLVRMVGIRNAAAGVRTLQADEKDVKRALAAGLALGAVDTTAVLIAARRGTISKGSAAFTLAVLAGIAWLGVRAGRD